MTMCLGRPWTRRDTLQTEILGKGSERRHSRNSPRNSCECFFDAVAATVLSSVDKNQTTNNYSSSTQQHCRIESCLAGSCRASRCELPRMLVLSGLESLLYACQFDLLSTLDRLRDKIRARSWLCGYLYDLYAELWQMHPMEMISFTLDFPAHKSQQDPTSTTYDLGTLELIILCR